MAKNLLQNTTDLVQVTPVIGTPGIVSPSGMVRIRSITQTSSTATSQFINLTQYPYTNYRLIGNITSLSTTSNYAQIQVSINNGASYAASGYTEGLTFSQYNTASFSQSGPFTNGISIFEINSFLAGICFFTDVYILNVNTSANYFTAYGRSIEYNTGTSTTQSNSYGSYNTLTAINAIQINPNGTTTSSTYTLYGIN